MEYNEFEIISKFFKNHQKKDKNQIKGIGDDSALIKIPKNNLLAISTDTLVEGKHFLKNITPKDLAYKSVAVNLSDLAAMGAKPTWITLSITMPKSDSVWLKSFSKSFFKILNKYKLNLIGGDTNSGPLSITLSIYGLIEGKNALLRGNAKNGDLIYITGNLGESAAGLSLLQKKTFLKNVKICNYLIKKHLKPIPRISEGIALRNIANAAIDISDGLISDLGHILKNSKCGADINLNTIPISKILTDNFKIDEYLNWALNSGEDYELCFTISKKNIKKLNVAIKKKIIKCTCIGYITSAEKGLNLIQNQKKIIFKKSGFNHFI
ncbi:thiamine-phosphate kinase [Buchnera aphidicola]|jgi:thiamine-monophosphate kinase|uniref:Thiamine-monophosphate kinase n=1 Tax=Buchnera aphidicola subsp. Schizaphis graminum (strain Sg) TaxID=198804 RepID=THIL_BUCAP|nr:thiamine-phosphate kinase [Buchnera aphidicola]Q8K9A5.1 RecName: Full=Thiamine-monophosphate kinase; Short=TMP kinase; Short=Thiamine-phosphate kinase [Buchnera aphidicola str. Sg (Schizaphis graminum)]AAM67987.1 thiamine-monophosphate kinase [Buchnera aphidicola str. Sg (Schizaphis graminum)]AWI49520.1 thiamine-monophosphate kinase [Buchnera aphidicola (Schizaphis graminum)]